MGKQDPNVSVQEDNYQVHDITHLYFLLTDPIKEVQTKEAVDMSDLKFRQFKTFKDFIQRDKIQVNHKVAMMRQNLALVARDPGKERKEYWNSIIGPDLQQAYLSIYDKGRKAFDRLKFREYDIKMAVNHLKEFMNITEKDPFFNKIVNVIKIIMKQEPFFSYSKIWVILAATMVKAYEDEQAAFFFTYFILTEVFPANYFRVEFRKCCKSIYARIFNHMVNFMFQDFQGHLTIDTKVDGEIKQNQEALQSFNILFMENVVEVFFYTAFKSQSTFMRMLDYLMIYRYDLIFKLAVKSIDLVREEVKNTLNNKVNAKQINVASLIYALSHMMPILLSSKLHCSSMLKYIDNILANELYRDLVKFQYSPAASKAIKDEWQEKFDATNRIVQIKRVIGLLHLMEMGITKEKLKSCMDNLNSKPSDTRTISQLASLMNATSKTECIINKTGLMYVFGLCPSAVSDKVKDLDFRFIMTLISKTKADIKISQCILIFANDILEKQGKLNEEGKLLQSFNKQAEVQEVLYNFEHTLDSRLNYYNKGSTIMHVCKENLTRIEIIKNIMSDEQGFYLYKLIIGINGKKLEDELPIYQTCHFMSHYQYLKSKNGPEFTKLTKKQGAKQDKNDEKKFKKFLSENDRKANLLNKYRSQGLRLKEDEKAAAQMSEEDVDEAFDRRRVYADKKVKVDQFGKFLDFKENDDKYGMILVTIEDDQRERYDTSYFEDATENYIRNPIKKLGQIFSFTNATMQTQQDTIYEADEDNIGGLNKPSSNGDQQVITRKQTMDKKDAVYMDRETEENHLYKQIKTEFEETMVDVVAATGEYLKDLYAYIYIDSLVKVIEKNDVDVAKKEANFQVEIETEVSQHSFALSANMEDLEVFVYGMAKKDAMVDQSQIVLKEELLEDDRDQLAEEKRRRDEQRDMLAQDSKDALEREQKRLREEFEGQQQKMREKMDRELKYIRDEFAQKQQEQDDFFEKEREIMEKKQEDLQREGERLLRAEEKRLVKEENFRKMKEKEKEDERLRKIAEEEEKFRIEEEARIAREYQAQPEQIKQKAMEELVQKREDEKAALKADAELEVITPQEVLATRLNPESNKIHAWENSSEDLETDNLIKKQKKKDKEKQEKQEIMEQSKVLGFSSSSSEEELPPALKFQRGCQNVVINGYQFIADLFQGTPKKKKDTTKKGSKSKKISKKGGSKSGNETDNKSANKSTAKSNNKSNNKNKNKKTKNKKK